MARRTHRLCAVALFLTVVTMAGCTAFSDRVPGCVPPSNEAALLDEFANEPVLAVQPEGSKRREAPRRTEACHRLGEDVSVTSVWVQHDLPRNLGRDEVRSLYEPVAAKAGWAVLPTRVDDKVLRFCRRILDQPGLLEVGWQDGFTVDEGEHVPAMLAMGLHLTRPESHDQLAEVEAARAAGCWP